MYIKPDATFEVDPKDIPPARLLTSGRKLVTPEQRLFMKKLYVEGGLSTWRIGRAMGYLNVCVINNLKRAGVTLRNHSDSNKTLTVKRDYFETIDTHTKAYLLGLFYADGNIHKNSFTIALQERDKYLLEAIAKELGMTGTLACRPPKGVTKQNAWALRVYDKEFCTHLRRWGVVPRKTTKLSYPSFLDDKFFYSFLHGLLDGDGCITTKGNRITANVAGSPQITLDLKTKLEERLDIHLARYLPLHSKGTSITTSGTNAIRLLGEMYSHSKSPFWLTRKKDKFIDHMRRRVTLPITHTSQQPGLTLSQHYLEHLT